VINLLADGAVIDTKTVTEADQWSWSFTELPKYRDQGVEIVYTITEEAVTGYTTEVKGYNVTNTHETETTDVEGTKTWNDADDQDGIRPESIVINLLANGKKVDSATVTAANGWKWSFTGLDKYEDGKEIVYTITEEAVTGYTSKVNGYNVTNTHKPETTSVSGTKTWNDANDQDGKRPESIIINLLADGAVVDTKTVTEAEGWSWSFTDLDKFAAGKEIVYTITEETVAGYTAVVTGYDVENAYTPGVTSVNGTKTWVDNNDQDGIRPESIVINLLADGAVIDTKTVTAADSWSWSFTKLPIYRDGGIEIVYTITEEAVTGYTTEIDGYDVTNTHITETTDVEGTKTWVDADDQDGIRPESIVINLLADGAVIDTVTVTEADNWSWSFTELDKFAAGKEIVYTITEEAVTGYTTEVNGYDVINTHETETTDVEGTKTWVDADNQDGIRPESIIINLLADGAVIATKTVTEADNWSWSFTDLDKFAAGKEIVYTITEEAVTGYTTEIDGYDVINTHETETTDVEGTKTWVDADNQDGIRPATITINLLADGAVIDTKTVTEADQWSWSFTELPKYRDQGVEIVYTITEEAVTGYTTEINGYDVINTHETETTDVEGTKTWVDADNQDGIRPESIVINLLADGAVIATKTVTEAEGWSWSFTDLDKFAAGKEIVYTITEEAVAGYTTEIDGYDVTNTHITATTDVEGTKTWVDADNQDGKRPESIIINLLADGAVIATKTVTEADNWSWSFTDLDKFAAGKEIVYTITEEAVTGYTTEIEGYNAINTHITETTEVTGTKTWVDADNQDGIRPVSIVIKLMDGETVVKTATVTEADQWSWSFTDLPKYRAGKVGEEIVYTIAEEAVTGYTAEVTGYDVTNTHKPETTEITGKKTWNDLNNIYFKRPDSVTIRLLADGVEIDNRVVTEADNWSWTFADLPVYKAGAVGQKINYTITEDVVTGYITTVEDYNVLNTMNMVEFIKLDEQTGKTLPGAQFALYEGGAATAGLGQPVETWTSGTGSKILAGLKVGQTYTIVETKAPSGFVAMAPFVFTVELTDIPGTYRSFSASNCHEYRFRKLDSETKGIVYGATLAIMQGDTVIESWVTDGSNDGWHYVADSRLTAGVQYTLVEKITPYGYLTADPMTFTISADDGMLIVNGVNTNGSSMIMYDQPIPEVTPTPEPTTIEVKVTKRWEDKDDVLGLRPEKITIQLFQKDRSQTEYPATPFMTVDMMDNGKNTWTFTFTDLPRRSPEGFLYDYMIVEEEVPGYTVKYLNDGRTIINTIPEEDFPPTPTPTLPNVTPTPTPTGRVPYGVRFVDGEWVYIDEFGVPLGGVPLTGDETNFILWGAAIALPMLVAALAAVEIRRRKKAAAAARNGQAK